MNKLPKCPLVCCRFYQTGKSVITNLDYMKFEFNTIAADRGAAKPQTVPKIS